MGVEISNMSTGRHNSGAQGDGSIARCKKSATPQYPETLDFKALLKMRTLQFLCNGLYGTRKICPITFFPQNVNNFCGIVTFGGFYRISCIKPRSHFVFHVLELYSFDDRIFNIWTI